MDQLWASLIAQVPATAAVIFLVLKFLEHLRASDLSREKAQQALADQVRAMNQEFHAFQDDITDRVTTVINRNTEVMARTAVVLDRVERRLDIAEADARPPRGHRTQAHPPSQPSGPQSPTSGEGPK